MQKDHPMTAATAPKSAQPRRLTRLRVDEVSVVGRPANQHAHILVVKGLDQRHADLDQRLVAMERREMRHAGPSRLLKAAREAGDRLQAQAQGRAYHAPLPDAPVAKGAGGGAALVARCTAIRKDMLAAAAPIEAGQPAQVAKATSGGGRLVEAARQRAALLKAG
jgi:hypothetical protein